MSVQYIYPAQNARVEADPAFQGSAGATDDSSASSSDFSFKDILDAVNPLQQLPIVGSVYRAVTGDTISPGAQIMGGALYGGPIGFVVSALTAGITNGSGGNVGDMLVAMVTGGGNTSTQYAAAQYQKAQGMVS